MRDECADVPMCRCIDVPMCRCADWGLTKKSVIADLIRNLLQLTVIADLIRNCEAIDLAQSLAIIRRSRIKHGMTKLLFSQPQKAIL
ncbi:hypothetical protein LJC52_03730 [Bacteroidales bacterium OttesenSCG-928-A17]|nr:hypothetical protein [Bacteroidales bacterium OttesenSCG-928-A17]